MRKHTANIERAGKIVLTIISETACGGYGIPTNLANTEDGKELRLGERSRRCQCYSTNRTLHYLKSRLTLGTIYSPLECWTAWSSVFSLSVFARLRYEIEMAADMFNVCQLLDDSSPRCRETLTTNSHQG